jgi:hypothetical protein
MKPLLDPPPDPVAKAVRGWALLLAAYVAAVHLALAEDRYKEDAHYVGALFVIGAMGLVIGAAIAAGGRKFGSPVVVGSWLLGVVVAVGMFLGFVLSRTVGLPSYHRHDWPVIQVIALVAEAAYVALAARALPRLVRR